MCLSSCFLPNFSPQSISLVCLLSGRIIHSHLNPIESQLLSHKKIQGGRVAKNAPPQKSSQIPSRAAARMAALRDRRAPTGACRAAGREGGPTDCYTTHGVVEPEHTQQSLQQNSTTRSTGGTTAGSRDPPPRPTVAKMTQNFGKPQNDCAGKERLPWTPPTTKLQNLARYHHISTQI